MGKKVQEEKFDIDFEISFYEGVVRNQPNFIEALAALGDLYTKKGLYRDGLKVDEHLSQLKPDDPIVLYNLACSYSLLKEVDKAYRTIKRAIGEGYSEWEMLEEDEDLENLRADRRFQDYYTRLKQKISEER